MFCSGSIVGVSRKSAFVIKQSVEQQYLRGISKKRENPD